ncbi:MAG: cache domain-containing protein [Synergistaceae bacterium]
MVTLYLVAVALMHFYQQKTIRKEREHAYNVLQNTAKTQAEALNVALAGKYEILESLATVFEDDSDLETSKIIKYLNKVKDISGVSYMGFADIKGNSYLHDGRHAKINDREYFKKSIKGERAVEKIQKTKHSGIPVILISVPIKLGEEIKGVLFANYTEDHFCSLLSPYCFNNEGYSYICDDTGDIIITSKSLSFLTPEKRNIGYLLKNERLVKELAPEQILLNIKSSNPGVFSYTIGGKHRYAAYHPLGINNWVLFSAVPATSVYYEELAFISRSGQISMLIVVLSAMALFLIVIVMDYRERKSLEVEKEMLRISEEEYRIFVEQSEKLLYRYDVKTKTIYSHPAMAETIGVPMVFKYDSESAVKSGIILKESLEEHARFYEAMSNGEPTGSTVLNIRKTSGENAWYRGVFTMIYNDDGSPKHAIISMEDVTAQREKELAYELWRKKIKSDGLTKNVIYYDCNLTKDVCERKEGSLGFGVIDDIGSAFTDVIEYATKNIVYENDSDDFKDFFQKDRLLAQYYRGGFRGKF